jgi:putative phage-type endonuclease
MEIINVEQGTPEWLAARMGLVTASEIDAVMATGRGGGVSKTRQTYMMRLAAEIITETPCASFEGNADTERGKELEPEARELYEARTGLKVEQVGFCKAADMGCSPDGLVGTDGGVEIKCKRPYIHLNVLTSGEVPPELMGQIQASMYVTGRDWWDFVCYSKGLPLFIKRVPRDEEKIAEIKEAVAKFNAERETLVNQIMKMY